MSDNGAPPALKHDDWTAGAIAEFCDWLIRVNLVKEDTAANWKRGFTRILEEVEGEGWEQTGVKGIDTEVLFRRFDNAAGMKFKPATMSAYKKRFVTAVEEYTRWYEDRSSYRPNVTPRKRQSKDQSKEQTNNATERSTVENSSSAPETHGGDLGSSGAPTPQVVSSMDSAPMLEYPFPVRSGVVARFHLPTDLRPDEAERIAKFIASIAVSTPAALLSGATE